MGKSNNIDKLNKKLKVSIDKKSVKRAMILGGGKIGYYLAQRLTASNINVTIVEQDKSRCHYISERLDNALVIHGDGTDINLLEEEDLASMDAFIGVNKTVAKISRPSYVHVIDKLGIDAAINPVNITASNILKYIRGGKVVSVSLLLGGEGEVTEIIIGEDLTIVGKPICELGLPKGIIIGAIVHNGEVFIPNGKSVIYPKDRIIVFCLTSDMPALKMFFKKSKGGILGELWNSN